MSLDNIRESVQNISEAIASVVGVDVTVVDDILKRVAGTGSYKKCIGENISFNSAFGDVLKTGKSLIIEEPRKHEVCLRCEVRGSCIEFAEVCCPIILEKEVVGVIGLIAFDEEKRDKILENKDNLMNFLGRMADLVASKLLESKNTKEIELLAKKLETVIDCVDKGIVLVNNEGNILMENKNAIDIFGLKGLKGKKIQSIIGKSQYDNIIKNGSKLSNIEFSYKDKKNQIRGFFDASPIEIDNKSIGVVFVFSKISDVLSIVNRVSTGTITTSFEEIIGTSSILDETKKKAKKASLSSSTVMIQGESGTGKELFARAIHFSSSRSKGPFIALNCSAIPEHLLESELFGYEEGAFTGAKRGGKEGKFLLASTGTLFLDEIGDMPLHLQTKLLRVLQEGMIEKIGGKSPIPIDIRIIAATNKDLEQMVDEKEFRDDLFYRINVIPLQIPSLRERKEDIIILVDYLIKKCNKKLGKDVKGISDEGMKALLNYGWPGNVRELENSIEYAVNMSSSSVITLQSLPKRILKKDYSSLDDKGIINLQELEKREIIKTIKYCKENNISLKEGATFLGIGKATLYRKIKEYNIEIKSENI